MEVHIFTEAERGRRAKDASRTEPVSLGVGEGRGKKPSTEPAKWERLGFDSETEMEA